MSNLQPYQYEPTYTDEQVLANEKKNKNKFQSSVDVQGIRHGAIV